MSSTAEPEHGSRPLTARGAATRDRIVRAAADLMHQQGVAGTTLDQVIEASGTSKSQLYHYFPDKDALVAAVIRVQSRRVFDRQDPVLVQLDSFDGLRAWCDLVVRHVEQRQGANGCEIGSMVSELADRSESARILLAATLGNWESYFSAGFSRMQARGRLSEDADPADLATALMAAYQGGYLLSQASRSVRPLRLALDMVLAQVESLLVS